MKATTTTMIIKIKLQPRAKKNEIVETLSDGTIKIKLVTPPIEGRANIALIEFLAEHYHVPKSSISIIQGQTNRNKTIKIDSL